MICSLCHQYGIYWQELGLFPSTHCPHCGGTNCQEPEPKPELDDSDEEDEAE